MSEENKNNPLELKRFGRYLLLDHLVDGGMAKISRARYLGEQADKLVAIKMIQAQYSRDPSFRKMFMDEIKVTFGLNHPNIAQIYDYGIIDDQLYTAMEYVDGANLKEFLDRLRERRYVFPVEISVYIISQVCQGLNYAHRFTDKLTGKSLNIIHRDISPHNIMITYDGAVKIIDFGIAKADTNSEQTQAGTIKGKISYLAPEYLDGQELDPRYDLFAVGITLWELLCSRKLFQATNELAILKKIQVCKVPPPSSINPNVPKDLDEIVLKALKKDRNLRYENMDQFNRALVKFLYSNYPDFNPSDLGYFAKELFKDLIQRDKERFVEFGKIDLSRFLEELRNEKEGVGMLASDKAEPRKIHIIDLGFEENSTSFIKKTPPISGNIDLELAPTNLNGKSAGVQNPPNPSLNRPSSNGKVTPDVKKLKEGTKEANTSKEGRGNFSNPNKDENNNFESSSKASKGVQQRKPDTMDGKNRHEKTRTIEFKTRTVGTHSEKHNKTSLLLKVAMVLLFVSGIAFFKRDLLLGMLGIKGKSLTIMALRNPSSLVSSKSGSGEEEGDEENTKKVVFTNTNPYQRFFIYNQEVEYGTFGISLPLNKEIYLRVEQENMKPIFMTFEITKNGPTSIALPHSEPGIFGVLRSSEIYPPGSTLTYKIKGNEVIRELPIKDLKVLVGKYEGYITFGDSQAVKDIKFEILENGVTELP